jgi:hypothetical protein
MSERFGIPDHAPQHAPDHALQNPTASGGFGNIGGGGDSWGYPAPAAEYTGGGGLVMPTGPYIRSYPLAVVLAAILGPFGLFYLGILNGVAALVTVPYMVRSIAYAMAIASGGNMDTVYKVAVPVLWCITIPWAVIGVTLRNASSRRKWNRK